MRRNCRLRIFDFRFSICFLLFAILQSGCAYYSFTGGTIPEHIETIAIPLVDDNTDSPIAALDEQLTDLLIDRFVRQTRLSLEPNENQADAVLDVTLTDYRSQQAAVQEEATQVRLTISASVQYYDQVNDEELMQQRYSGQAQFDPITEGLQGERDAAQSALEDIADDIFSDATSNW